MKEYEIQKIRTDSLENQIRINNLKNTPARGREFSWGINQWAGFTSSQPQQTVNNKLFGSVALNVTPELFKISKAPGAEAVGYFRDINPHQNQKNLICGALEIRRKGDYLFCIVQDTNTKLSSFYIIKDDYAGNLATEGYWDRFNPIVYKKQELVSNFNGQLDFGIPPNAKIGNVYLNGILLRLNTNYTIVSGQISLIAPTTTITGDKLMFTYYIPDSSGFAEEYKFKGTYFDYAIDKSYLYLCSGKEEYTDIEGYTSGLLRFDLEKNQWSSIPTGKSAPLDLSKTAKTIWQDVVNPYNGEDISVYINSLEEFNPSIVEVYKERLLIAGSISNPYQVKSSEYQNMRNFVDNVLGQAVVPATEEDRRRPSTFFTELPIRSMNTFGESVIIGTKSKFYSYSLVDTGIADVDRLTPDDNSNSGTINNKSCKVYKGGQFYFASSHQIIPELSNRVLESKISQFGKPYTTATPPEKLTFLIDETCKRIDASNSAVGVYKNSILWSVAYCSDQENEFEIDEITGYRLEPVKNNLTILYSKQGDTPMYAIWTHIRANHFAEIGRRGLIYSSADNGNVYKINENTPYVNNHYNRYNQGDLGVVSDKSTEYEDFTSTIQTGLVGVDTANDSRFTKKKTSRLYFVGGFSSADSSEGGGTLLNIEIFRAGTNCDSGCCVEPIYSDNFYLSDTCEKSACDCNLEVDVNYFNGQKLVERFIELPEEFYHECYITIRVSNTTNFYINEIGGMYTKADNDPFDDAMILCPEKDELGDELLGSVEVETTSGKVEYECNVCKI